MISLLVLLELLEHHWHLHLLHEHHGIELHHLLAVFRVLVGAIHAVARIVEFAHYLWVQVHALLAVGALREELALLTRVVVGTLALALVARWEVPATHQLLLSRLLPLE